MRFANGRFDTFTCNKLFKQYVLYGLGIQLESNWSLATNSNFPIPISLQPYTVNIWYFKRKSNRMHRLTYLRSTTFDWKDIGIRKSKCVAKTCNLSSSKHNFYPWNPLRKRSFSNRTNFWNFIKTRLLVRYAPIFYLNCEHCFFVFIVKP